MARLRNLPNKEPFEGFNFRLRKTRADELKRYLDFVCGKEPKISMQELLASIVETFVDDDKEFQRHKLLRPVRGRSRNRSAEPAEPADPADPAES